MNESEKNEAKFTKISHIFMDFEPFEDGVWKNKGHDDLMDYFQKTKRVTILFSLKSKD